jgi:uncharacterized protein
MPTLESGPSHPIALGQEFESSPAVVTSRRVRTELPADRLRRQLQKDVIQAAKEGRREDVGALRSVLAAIDNAGAVVGSAHRYPRPVSEHVKSAGHEAASTETARLELSVSELRDIIDGLVTELTNIASFCDSRGRTDDADSARSESEFIRQYRPTT